MIFTASPARNGTTHSISAAARPFFVWSINQAVPTAYSAAVPTTMNAGSFQPGVGSAPSPLTARPVIHAQAR